MHSTGVKIQQYYKTLTPTRFGVYLPITSEHANTYNHFLTFPFFACKQNCRQFCCMQKMEKLRKWFI